jgi:DNA-binding response OmpR family regulator
MLIKICMVARVCLYHLIYFSDKMVKILCLEPHPDISAAIKYVFEQKGYEVAVVHSVRECIISAAAIEYDLIMIDTPLSGMSMRDFIKALKNNRSSKFIAMGIVPLMSYELKELLSAGVSDYVVKPFQISDMVKVVDRLCPKTVQKN